MRFNVDSARMMLQFAGLFFEDADEPQWSQTLNLNDTFGWAIADCESVSDEDLPKVAELFWRYGYAGVLYWVSERRGGQRSEFQDINRFIDFARAEELIRSEEPSDTKRAYLHKEYTLGADEAEE